MVTSRVLVTPEASVVIKELQIRFGELMFHQSGGKSNRLRSFKIIII